MNNYRFGNLTRISKPAARRLFMEGKPITITACNIRPDNSFGVAVASLSRKWAEEFTADEIGVGNWFENMVGSFAYYNCNAETGRRIWFWAED